ncbi:MAG: outer membrane lipoprotein-sorting protein [Pseudomonadota bacterium]
MSIQTPSPFLRGLAEAVIKQRRAIIVVIALITAVLGFFAAKQKVIINPATVVPQSHRYIQATNEVQRIFGSKYLVVIGISPTQGDAYQPAVLGQVERLTHELERMPGVVKRTLLSLSSRQAKQIVGTADGFEVHPLMPAVPKTAEEVSALKRAIQENPAYKDIVMSADGKTATILLELEENADGFGAMLKNVHKAVEGAKSDAVRIDISGNPVFLEQAEIFAERIGILFGLAVLVIGLLHWEAFRTWQGFIIPLVTALLSVVWGTGIMGLAGIPMDIFNSPTPILILAIAAGHSVQLLKRYYDEFTLLAPNMPGMEANREAVVMSFIKTGPALVIAGGVAAIGFFSLVLFDIQTIRAFGVFTGLGILTAVLLELTFIPALRSMLKPPSARQLAIEHKIRFWDKLVQYFLSLSTTPAKRRVVFIAWGVIGVVLLAGWNMIRIDNASKTFFSERLSLVQEDARLNQQTGGTNALYLMIDTGMTDGMKDPAVLQAIEKLTAQARRYGEVGKTMYIGDFLTRMHRAVHGDSADFNRLPETKELIGQYLFLYSMSGEPDAFDAWVDSDYRRGKVAIFLRTNSNAYIQALVKDLEKQAATGFPGGVSVRFGGEVSQTLAVTEVMVNAKLLNICQVLGVIFVVSALAFGSLYAGLFVLVPLVAVVLAVFGVMGYADIPLNIPNSLIAAMAVGIGADYAIYLLYRTREACLEGVPLTEAVYSAMLSAGKACLFVATAVAGGYAVLLLSYNFNVHVWLSMFIVLAMIVSVVATLTLLPALMLATRPSFITQSRGNARLAVAAIALACMGLLGYAGVAKADTLSATEVMSRNDDATRVPASVGQARFTLIGKDGGQRQRDTVAYTKQVSGSRDSMRMVRFLSPGDIKGTATLLIEHSSADDDMWVYLPALKKVRRLVAANKRDGFAGTDFSYGDMIGYQLDDWQHAALPDATVDGAPCYVITSVPKNDKIKQETGISKRTSWIRKDNFVAIRVETVDHNNEPLKRYQFSEVKAVGKSKWQAMRMEAENIASKHRTSIQFSEFKVSDTLPDDMFKPAALERAE